MRPAVFLDRDGVVNESVRDGDVLRPPRTVEELRVPPGTREALDRLRQAGFVLVVVTNQPDVARGTLTHEAVDTLNRRLSEELGLDGAYACEHDNDDACHCRKPLPGMLHDAADDLLLDLRRSWLVGDRWVDIAAGAAAGVRTLLLETPESLLPTSAGSCPPAVTAEAAFRTLSECVDYILAGSGVTP